MNIKNIAAGVIALAIPAIPSAALAQVRFYVEPQPSAPEPATTRVSIIPPVSGSVFVYEGRRLLGRFEGPGAIWVPTGDVYHIVAMRNGQVVWTGDHAADGTPLDLRWSQEQTWIPSTQCQPAWPPGSFAYPPRQLTPPSEIGRQRTPLP